MAWGWPAAVLVAVVMRVLIPWLESRATRETAPVDESAALQLTLAMAVCHSAGTSGPDAWRECADAVSVAPARLCRHLAQEVQQGAPYAVALMEMAQAEPALVGLCHVLGRAEVTGAPAAAALVDLARQLGADVHSRHLQRVRRLGVRAALPLGLCFLPAFVLLGVVPIAAGLI